MVVFFNKKFSCPFFLNQCSSNRLKKQLFKRKPIYEDSDGKDGEIVALNKAVVSSKPSGKAKQVTMAANRPGSGPQDFQLTRSSDDDRRLNGSQSSNRGNRVHRGVNRNDTENRVTGRSSSGNRTSRYQNEYRDEVDETFSGGDDGRVGERFPMPDRKPLLYTTSVNTTTDPYSNTLDINTRIRLTQV